MMIPTKDNMYRALNIYEISDLFQEFNPFGTPSHLYENDDNCIVESGFRVSWSGIQN